jgi:2-dehydropantoate 2-reductase
VGDVPFLIVGTGALACLFAARLAAVGTPVAMLGSWPEGLAALRRDGVRLEGADGKVQAYPVQATNDPLECAGACCALVLVKSWQTGRAAGHLAECLAPNGLALTLQNGLGNREALEQVLGARRVALGVTTLGATLLGPGLVRPAGDGAVTLGEHPNLEAMAGPLRAAGFTVETVSEPLSLLWGKLVINAAINPLTALLGVRNGELLERPSARELMASAVAETVAVADSLGISLPYVDPLAAVETIARRTAANRSSMLQDVLRGAPTEIDVICGAIVQAGERAGALTPINRTLWQLVKALKENPDERPHL